MIQISTSQFRDVRTIVAKNDTRRTNIIFLKSSIYRNIGIKSFLRLLIHHRNLRTELCPFNGLSLGDLPQVQRWIGDRGNSNFTLNLCVALSFDIDDTGHIVLFMTCFQRLRFPRFECKFSIAMEGQGIASCIGNGDSVFNGVRRFYAVQLHNE